MLYAIAILVLLAFAGVVAGWIKAPGGPRWVWAVLFSCLVLLAAFLTYRQFSPSSQGGSESSRPGKMLSAESPVKVRWLGQGDTIEITWKPQDYPELHNYSVDVYGLSPVAIDYNVGYRIGEELRTSDTANPISEANEWARVE